MFEVCAKPSIAVIVIALDGVLFYGPVQALNLAVGPRMLDLGCPELVVLFATGAAKYVCAGEVILFAIGELNAIIGENNKNGVRQYLDQIGQES